MGKILSIPVTKAKAAMEIDTDLLETLPEEVYREIIIQGLKTLLNRGTSKITKTTYPNEEELKAAATAAAEKQLQDMKDGKIKLSAGAKSKKASGAVMTEARRLAKNLVKAAMKAKGIKVSHVDAKEITKAANAVLDDPEQGKKLIEQAEANLAERAEVAVSGDILAAIAINPEKKAKAEKKSAEEKEARQLSKTQAGQVQPRAKGGKGKGATQATA